MIPETENPQHSGKCAVDPGRYLTLIPQCCFSRGTALMYVKVMTRSILSSTTYSIARTTRALVLEQNKNSPWPSD